MRIIYPDIGNIPATSVTRSTISNSSANFRILLYQDSACNYRTSWSETSSVDELCWTETKTTPCIWPHFSSQLSILIKNFSSSSTNSNELLTHVFRGSRWGPCLIWNGDQILLPGIHNIQPTKCACICHNIKSESNLIAHRPAKYYIPLPSYRGYGNRRTASSQSLPTLYHYELNNIECINADHS